MFSHGPERLDRLLVAGSEKAEQAHGRPCEVVPTPFWAETARSA